MAIIAFVPARCGSKSIPFKNVKAFCGKPLIYWNLKALHDVQKIDEIVVATDCDQIADKVKAFELPKVKIYWRSVENASDTSSTESVMLEYLEKQRDTYKADDFFILSQLTSPFTTAQHFQEALAQLSIEKKDSLLSCVRIRRFFWNEDGVPENYDYRSRPRRQDFKGTLLENGAFYINKIGNILRNRNRLSGSIAVYEMPEYTQTEIDEPHDWVVAEQLFKATVYTSFSNPLLARIKKIKIILSDVDGVLTDSGMYYSEKGDELKKFNTRDGKGFELLRNAGFKVGIITSENTDIVTRRAQKLKLDYVYQEVTNSGKLGAVKEICSKENIKIDEVAYIGDDVNCFEVLQSVGLAACPSDAEEIIKAIPSIEVLQTRGGQGVLRSLANLILANRQVIV